MKDAVLHTKTSVFERISEESRKKYQLLIFLIWPFIGFIMACRDFSSRLNRNLILVFYTLYGFTFFVNPAMDGERYANQLLRVYDIPFENRDKIFEGLFSEEGELDLLQPALTFLVSRFTSYPGILFAVFALVFGLLQLKTIYMVYQDTEGHRNKNVIALLCYLPLLLPIFSINGFRMWTAAWLFAYGVYNYAYRNKKLYLFVALSAILVHFSFITVSIVLLIYVFAGNRKWIYTVLASISFMLSELPLPAIEAYVENFGSGITRKFNSYTNTKYTKTVEEYKQQAAWFITLSSVTLKYFFTIAMGSMYFRIGKVKVSKEFNSLWCVTLLILTYANLASTVPSGGRFLTVYYILATLLLIIFYAHYYNTRKLDPIILFGIFPMLLTAAISTRVGLNTTNITLLMPSPIIAIFSDNGMPIIK